MSINRVAIFDPDPDLATNPTLTSMIEALSRQGVIVDVVMPFNHQFPLMENKASMASYRTIFSFKKVSLSAMIQQIIALINRFKLELLFRMHRYDIAFGVNCRGLIKASKYAFRYNTTLVYLSFEMVFLDELIKLKDIREKYDEIVASMKAQIVLIQDENRAELFAKENNIPFEKFEYIPVSPSSAFRAGKNNFLRRKFNIPDEKKIVLHPGSLSEWTYTAELINSTKYWPERFVLILHSRYRPGPSDKYIRMVKESKSSNVYISEEPLNDREYEKIIRSSDIGLVLYKSIPYSKYAQKNISNIGLASGKFSYFMKYGIPAITIDQPHYKCLLSQYEFGVHLNSISELHNGLILIDKNYDYYQVEAKRLFEEKLDFDLHWPRFWERLCVSK